VTAEPGGPTAGSDDHPTTGPDEVTAGIRAFYDDLAPTYDRIFADWAASSRRQGEVLTGLLAAALGSGPLRVLDAACGIGTQLLGLARCGHTVCGSDLSPGAAREAALRASAAQAAGLSGRVAGLVVADLRALPYAAGGFDAVVCADNSLPHLLTADGVTAALGELRRVVRAGGAAVVTTRDYDALAAERPAASGPQVSVDADGQKVVTVQLWDWSADGPCYRLTHLQSAQDGTGGWTTRSRTTVYRAWQRAELTGHAAAAGWRRSRWLTPQESGWYQPLLLART